MTRQVDLRWVEVLQEFATDDEGVYSPPWRERFENGELGPWYGPKGLSAWEQAQRLYEESFDGAGLWDHEQDTKARKHKRDGDWVLDAFKSSPYSFTDNEAQVLVSYFWDQHSIRYIAQFMDVSFQRVHAILGNVRIKARCLGVDK